MPKDTFKVTVNDASETRIVGQPAKDRKTKEPAASAEATKGVSDADQA